MKLVSGMILVGRGVAGHPGVDGVVGDGHVSGAPAEEMMFCPMRRVAREFLSPTSNRSYMCTAYTQECVTSASESAECSRRHLEY